MFSALVPGVGNTRNTDVTRNASPTANEDANNGAFDQMLQSRPQARADGPDHSRTAGTGKKAEGRERANDAREDAASEAKPRTRESGESRATSESKPREAGPDAGGERDTTAAGDEAAPVAASDAMQPEATAGAQPAAAAPAPTQAAAPATLPEQLLALLNGLPAAAGPATTTAGDTLAADTDTTARTGLAARGSTGLPLPIAMQAAATAAGAAGTTAASAAEGDPSVFAAMTAMAAANDGGTDVDPLALGDNPAPTVAATTATSPASAVRSAAAVAPQAPVAMDANFDDTFGSRIAWMAEQRVGHAEIRVSPDHLGTIDVRLQLDGTRVNAEFHSAQADVRHALESSLPRLREMLGQSGLQLGQADVGQRQNGQPSPSNGQAGSTAQAGGNERIADSGRAPGPAVRASRGLLDEYA